jgi:hypothetical protein
MESKKEMLKARFESWIVSWLALPSNLINIITFTVYYPWWDFKFLAWTAKRRMKSYIQKEGLNSGKEERD